MSLTPEKKAKLEQLAKSTNKMVAEAAKKQLAEAGAGEKKEEKKTEKKAKAKKVAAAAAPAVKKEEKKPAAPAKKERKPTKDEIEECEKLLNKQMQDHERTKKWKKSRAKKGLPEKKTSVEILDDSADKVAERTKEQLKKGEGLSKKELSSLRTQIKHLVKVITTGITDAAEKKAFIKELIEELKKSL